MSPQKHRLSERLGKENFRYLCLLLANTAIAFFLYRILISYGELTGETFYSFVAMLAYSALLLGFGFGYLIYNRFLYRNNITKDQLPEEWSEEKKAEFFVNAKQRLAKSRWMLTVIFPLLFTFFFDALVLFIIEPVFGI